LVHAISMHFFWSWDVSYPINKVLFSYSKAFNYLYRLQILTRAIFLHPDQDEEYSTCVWREQHDQVMHNILWGSSDFYW
jgi:hypothetical protein